MTNYDSIARIYDLLSRMIFGRHLIEVQTCLIKYIPPGSSILIVGGGTGWILEAIAAQYPQGLKIDYVESSEKMILLSTQRNCKLNVVNFIHRPIEDHSTAKQYDIVFTPFLFDNFRKEKIEVVFEKLNGMLKTEGIWLFADFVNERNKSPYWQSILLRTMYLFFHITCGIEANELVNIDSYFASTFRLDFEVYRFSKFIRSAAYSKSATRHTS